LQLLFSIGFLEIHWVDIIDILLVSALLYNFYNLVKNTLALRVFIGFLSIYFLYLVVQATEMELMTAILGQFVGVGVIAAVILFQQELRRFLMMIGKTTSLNQDFFQFLFKKNKNPQNWNIEPILKALKNLSGLNMGALMVLSANEDPKNYINTGDLLDAELSERLLVSVFFKNSPLHDGAAILTEGKIKAARCILPVSENEKIPANLGLRHRAAIGISEVTNALVLVVSEETGQMSAVYRGQIKHNLALPQLREELNEYFAHADDEVGT
jgi:uncharacterized protein (TIGR00159 family)